MTFRTLVAVARCSLLSRHEIPASTSEGKIYQRKFLVKRSSSTFNQVDPDPSHGKLGCVYAVTITAMSILLLREGNFQVLVILK